MIYILLASFVLASGIGGYIAFAVGKQSGAIASDESIAALRDEARRLEEELVAVLVDVDKLTSTKQLTSLIESTNGLTEKASQAHQKFLDATAKIDTIQARVLSMEQEHQALRSVTLEEKNAVETALSVFKETSSECVSLEHKLADSLQTLDAMYSEVSLTEPQKAMFNELTTALTAASSQLRDVIVEYDGAHERLTLLNTRFEELEGEYSALIEKQLLG